MLIGFVDFSAGGFQGLPKRLQDPITASLNNVRVWGFMFRESKSPKPVYVVSDTWTAVLLGRRGKDCRCFRSCARWTRNGKDRNNTVCYPSNLNPNPYPLNSIFYTYALCLKEPDNQPRGAIILVQNIGIESNEQHVSNEIVLEHTRLGVTSQAQQTRCDGIERV